MLRISALVAGLLLAFLFREEKWGLNTFIFSTFLLILFGKHYGISNISGPVFIVALGTLFSSALIVMNDSDYSKTAWVLSLVLWMGFNQSKPIKSFVNAGILGCSNFFESPFLLFSGSTEEKKVSILKSFWKIATLLLIPLGLVALFFSIYYAANPKFAQLYDRIIKSFNEGPMLNLDPETLLHILLGTMLFGAIFFTSHLNGFFKRREESRIEDLIRKRRKVKDYFSALNTLSLKKEYKIGVLVLALLNLQLAVANLLDIVYVWFSFEKRGAQELSQFVHQGTSLLILGIVMAMIVILWFFRGNLNFLPHNRFIRQLVQAWIIQNALLTLSVGMRNIHYINAYGLAYKRIGVFFFLVLVLYGLWTMREKVQGPKTFFYLIQKNAWFFYFVLLAFSGVNWNVAITKYNLSKGAKNGIDTYFLIHLMPDHNLYLLLEQKEKLLSGSAADRAGILQDLENKKERFKHYHSRYSWKSFNLPDWKNEKYLNKKSH